MTLRQGEEAESHPPPPFPRNCSSVRSRDASAAVGLLQRSDLYEHHQKCPQLQSGARLSPPSGKPHPARSIINNLQVDGEEVTGLLHVWPFLDPPMCCCAKRSIIHAAPRVAVARLINQSCRAEIREDPVKKKKVCVCVGVGWGGLQHNVGKSEYQLAHAAVAVMQFGAFYCWAHMQVAMGDSFRRRVWGEIAA